jgi:hypothetical protein
MGVSWWLASKKGSSGITNNVDKLKEISELYTISPLVGSLRPQIYNHPGLLSPFYHVDVLRGDRW